MEGGRAQEDDDITAQPLKDELFSQHSSSAQPAAARRGGDLRQPCQTLDAGRWALDAGGGSNRGAPAATPVKVGAGRGLVLPPRLCWEDRGAQHGAERGQKVGVAGFSRVLESLGKVLFLPYS